MLSPWYGSFLIKTNHWPVGEQVNYTGPHMSGKGQRFILTRIGSILSICLPFLLVEISSTIIWGFTKYLTHKHRNLKWKSTEIEDPLHSKGDVEVGPWPLYSLVLLCTALVRIHWPHTVVKWYEFIVSKGTTPVQRQCSERVLCHI